MNLAVRNGTPLSCLMIDIDHFKAINDSYGHEAGDLVIKNVAAIIQRAVRDIGMAFRYGGEEFLVLLGGTDEEAAMACATDIYHSVQLLTLRYGWLKLVRSMCPSASPATRSIRKAIACCARLTLRSTGQKSWGGREL